MSDKSKKFAAFVVASFATLILAACSVGGGWGERAEPTEHGPSVSVTVTNDPAVTETPNVSVAIASFGQVVNIDGIAVSVTPLDGYVPGQYAAGYSGGVASAFVLVVENQSADVVNPWALYVTATAPGGQPVEMIFDSEQGVETPSGDLFPGEFSQWKIAFDGEVERVKVEIMSNWSAAPVYFMDV